MKSVWLLSLIVVEGIVPSAFAAVVQFGVHGTRPPVWVGGQRYDLDARIYPVGDSFELNLTRVPRPVKAALLGALRSGVPVQVVVDGRLQSVSEAHVLFERQPEPTLLARQAAAEASGCTMHLHIEK